MNPITLYRGPAADFALTGVEFLRGYRMPGWPKDPEAIVYAAEAFRSARKRNE